MTALALLVSTWCSVAISEIQAAPESSTPEWIEIADVAGADLGGWTLDDGSGRRAFPVGTVGPSGGVLVASSDCQGLRAAWPGVSIACASPSGWNRLSTDSDLVVLRDRSGRTVDSVAWTSRAWGDWPAGRSRERAALGSGSCDPRNWFPSTDEGGTPGWIPAGIGRGIGRLGLAPRGKVAVAGRRNVLDVAAPAGRALRLELCDLRRRRLAVLWDGEPPSDGVVEWEPRAEGRILAPGVYALLARSGGETIQAWIAVAKP